MNSSSTTVASGETETTRTVQEADEQEEQTEQAEAPAAARPDNSSRSNDRNVDRPNTPGATARGAAEGQPAAADEEVSVVVLGTKETPQQTKKKSPEPGQNAPEEPRDERGAPVADPIRNDRPPANNGDEAGPGKKPAGPPQPGPKGPPVVDNPERPVVDNPEQPVVYNPEPTRPPAPPVKHNPEPKGPPAPPVKHSPESPVKPGPAPIKPPPIVYNPNPDKVDCSAGVALSSDKLFSGNSTGVVPAPLPPGEYSITLGSEDPFHLPAYQTHQTDERWVLEVLDRNGTVIYTSPAIGDLDNDDTALVQQVATGVRLIDAAGLRARHVGSTANSNSIIPACATLHRTMQPHPCDLDWKPTAEIHAAERGHNNDDCCDDEWDFDGPTTKRERDNDCQPDPCETEWDLDEPRNARIRPNECEPNPCETEWDLDEPRNARIHPNECEPNPCEDKGDFDVNVAVRLPIDACGPILCNGEWDGGPVTRQVRGNDCPPDPCVDVLIEGAEATRGRDHNNDCGPILCEFDRSFDDCQPDPCGEGERAVPRECDPCDEGLRVPHPGAFDKDCRPSDCDLNLRVGGEGPNLDKCKVDLCENDGFIIDECPNTAVVVLDEIPEPDEEEVEVTVDDEETVDEETVEEDTDEEDTDEEDIDDEESVEEDTVEEDTVEEDTVEEDTVEEEEEETNDEEEAVQPEDDDDEEETIPVVVAEEVAAGAPQ